MKLMLPALESPEEIVQRLNTTLPTSEIGPWVVADENQALIKADLTPNISYNANRGWVVKTFISTRTGEVKLFLAKLLNVPGRENLWQ